MITLADIQVSILMALRAEPFIIGIVHDLLDLFERIKNGEPVSQAQLDEARQATQESVDIFDKAD